MKTSKYLLLKKSLKRENELLKLFNLIEFG